MSVQPTEIEFTDLSEFEEPTIPCEIPSFADSSCAMQGGVPNPAEWIAFRSVVCDCGIIVRLVCDQCREMYQQMMARHAYLYCPTCNTPTNGFDRFEPLKQGS